MNDDTDYGKHAVLSYIIANPTYFLNIRPFSGKTTNVRGIYNHVELLNPH